jgi:Family of unknown function (DUF5681)
MAHETVEESSPAIGELAADSLQKQQNARPRGRPFEPGQSGNPAGRLRGSRNRATRFAQALLDNDLEALVTKAIARALEGDALALKLCVERILSPQRQTRVSFEMPPLATAEDAMKALAAIAAATAEGELAPTEARDLSVPVNGFLKALETHDFERRLQALERSAAAT